MKKLLFILSILLLLFLGCNEKEKNMNALIVEKKNSSNVDNETIFWIDTISNGKFLKIYSKPKNNWQNLTAEYGTKNKKHQIDLHTKEFEILKIPFTNEIKWITEKSFALVNCCGTMCKYALIFNIENEKPIITPIEYYPEIKYADYKTDNKNLYITANDNQEENPSFIITETDSQKTDTIYLPKNWIRGNGAILNIIDKISIKNSKIEIVQKKENSKINKINKILILK